MVVTPLISLWITLASSCDGSVEPCNFAKLKLTGLPAVTSYLHKYCYFIIVSFRIFWYLGDLNLGLPLCWQVLLLWGMNWHPHTATLLNFIKLSKVVQFHKTIMWGFQKFMPQEMRACHNEVIPKFYSPTPKYHIFLKEKIIKL